LRLFYLILYRTALPGYFSAVNTAIYTGASDAAHVNGYIKKYGNQAFTFAVGSGSDLRALSISAPASATDAYAVAWISGDPGNNQDPTAPNAGAHPTASFSSPIIAVSNVGQWDWQVGNAGNLGTGTTGTGAGLTISVSIPDMTLFAETLNLRLVGWNGTSWIDLSGAPTATGNNEDDILSGTMVAGITAIGIGSVEIILPVKLKTFTAIASKCDALLRWITSEEINADKFTIEQSKDGLNYTPVASVNALGNMQGSSYSLLVTQPTDKAYYRLKMIDKNGSYTYSPIKLCTTNCSIKEYMSIYPNPVISNVNVQLSFETAYQGKATLIITNAQGQQVMNRTEQISKGANKIVIEIDRIAAGTYYIKLIDVDGEVIGTVQKLIKQ
jgi:hypothetical protein